MGKGLWYECNCDCHASEGSGLTNAVHSVPCCQKCNWCGYNIAGDLDAHIKDQHPQCAEIPTPPVKGNAMDVKSYALIVLAQLVTKSARASHIRFDDALIKTLQAVQGVGPEQKDQLMA